MTALCRAERKDNKVEESRKSQIQATEVIAEILKAKDKEATAEKYIDSLTEEFFHIGATYLSLAKKEANVEVVGLVEASLKAAMAAKNKTLRPEIRLFNQLVANNSTAERQQTIQEYHEYLHEGSYFFELLARMTKDVELQKDSSDKDKLLQTLRIISKQTKEVAKSIKRSNNQAR